LDMRLIEIAETASGGEQAVRLVFAERPGRNPGPIERLDFGVQIAGLYMVLFAVPIQRSAARWCKT
jgi:hypothetical protein